MITRALYRYLTDPRHLSGHPAEKFVEDVTVSGVVCTNRNEVRELIRSKVGKQIYAERRPQDSSAHTAVTLRTIGGNREYSTAGGCPWQISLIQVDVWCRGGDEVLRGNAVCRALQLAVDGFHHDYWDDIYIGEVAIERESMSLFPPVDGSDTWTYQESFDIAVHHQVPAAEHPLERLQAVVEFRDGFDVGDWLRITGENSIVPSNREIATVEWWLYIGDYDVHYGPYAAQHTEAFEALGLDVLIVPLGIELERGGFWILNAVTVRMRIVDNTGTISEVTEVQSG